MVRFSHLAASAALLASVLCPAQDAKDLKVRVESASVFEPGLVYLVRRAEIPAGEGRYRLSVVPESVKGSFWFQGSEGVQIVQSITRLQVIDRKEKAPLVSPAQLLAGNIGKHVRFKITYNMVPPKSERLEGVMEYAGPPPSSEAGLRLADGSLRKFDLFTVSEVTTTGLAREVQVETKVPERVIEFDVDAPKGGFIRVATLERGAGWGGSYAVTMDKADFGTLAFKIQLVMGGMKFDGTDVKLLSGLPSLPDRAAFDASSGVGGLNVFLTNADPTRRWNVELFDPFDQVDALVQRRQQLLFEKGFEFYRRSQNYYSGGYGGFGGGGYGGGGYGGVSLQGGQGLVPQGIDFISYDPTDNSIVVTPKDKRFDFSTSSAEVADLYSYSLGTLKLEPGDRLTRQLYDGPVTPESVIRWVGSMSTSGGIGSQDVGRYLQVKNASPFAWAPGPCFLMRSGVPLALTDMPFTAKGETADIRVSKADDIPHESFAKEISRTRTQADPPRYRIVYEVTLTTRNPRSEALKYDVRFSLEGKVLSAEGAEVTTTIPRISPNQIQQVEWKLSLPSGEKKELKFTYELQT